MSMRVPKLELSELEATDRGSVPEAEYSSSKNNVPEISSENTGSKFSNQLFKNLADSKILGSQNEILMDFIEFYESPLGRASSQLSDIAAKDWMQLHLHYRSVKVEEDNNEPGLADWMCTHASALVTYPRAQTPFTQVSEQRIHQNNGFTNTYNKVHSQFQESDKNIFTEIWNSLLIVQLAETSIPFSVKTGLKSDLNEVVSLTLKHFHHVLAFLRILASENDEKQIVCSPYGTTFVTRTMFFRKLTILYGIENAERALEMYDSLLVQMKKLSSYQLMILYFLVGVNIIDESIFENFPGQIRSVIRGLKFKVESLSSNLGLNEIGEGVLRWARSYKQSVNIS